MPAEKLYVEAIREPRRLGSGFDGYVILTLMRLPAEEASRKYELRDMIQSGLTGNVDRATLRTWHKEKEDICGPLETYVVEAREYRRGQVLDGVPAGAVPLEQWNERFYKPSDK